MRETGPIPPSVPIPKGFEFALFVTAMIWALAAGSIAGKAARGIVLRFNLPSLELLLSSLFLIFLAVLGFQLLDWIATRRGGETVAALPLPRRAGWPAEWATGAWIGWGLCLLAVLPVLVSANLHARLRLGAGSLIASLISLMTLLGVTLAEETIARGYGLRRLSAAIGPSWAAIVTSIGFAVALVFAAPPRHPLMALTGSFLFGLLLAMAYLRTHALWTGWGLHFAYRAVMAVALGLPIAGHSDMGAIAESWMTGSRTLTGGSFGLDAALFTMLAMVAGMAVLYRATRDYAWLYTHREILPAGYEVAVAPPAAHTAMERQTAAAPPPLVQILAATPVGITAAVPPPSRPVDESPAG